MARAVDRWTAWQLAQRRGLVVRGPHPLRERALEGAKLGPGQRVLDVGAGIGMLSLEARLRVGPSGVVVVLDRSRDALVACRRFATGQETVAATLQPAGGERDDVVPTGQASWAEPTAAPLGCVVSDACRLPFADRRFDAVVLRSVLIYLTEKALALRELHRVLRPGGRLSLFEPISRVAEELTQPWGAGDGVLAEQDRRGRAEAAAAEDHLAHFAARHVHPQRDSAKPRGR